MGTKAGAGVNLNLATRDMPSVDYFVMFSSISAAFGNAGKTNYGYANSALDEMCQVGGRNARRDDAEIKMKEERNVLDDKLKIRAIIGRAATITITNFRK